MESKKENVLVVINRDIETVKTYLQDKIGFDLKGELKAIENQDMMNSIADNDVLLLKSRTAIENHFKTLKRDPQDFINKCNASQGNWFEMIDKIRSKIKTALRIRMNKIAEEEAEEKRKIAAEEAEKERLRLESEKETAIKAGNTEVAEIIDTEIKETVLKVDEIKPQAQQSKSGFSTVTFGSTDPNSKDKKVITEFTITDHSLLAAWMNDCGLKGAVRLHDTAITAAKKSLELNDNGKTNVPGVTLKWDYDLKIRGRR